MQILRLIQQSLSKTTRLQMKKRSSSKRYKQSKVKRDNSEVLPNGSMMTTGEHLEALRKVLMKIILCALASAIVVFICKDTFFEIIFAPSRSDFILYRWINTLLTKVGWTDYLLNDFNVQLINTELSSQLITHIELSLYWGILLTSPYIIYCLFQYIKPALYETELKYSIIIILTIYLLFALGLATNYFIIFPISFRFLSTYQVSAIVQNTIALSSYSSSFLLLSFTMGLVFELPMLSFVLTKLGFIDADLLRRYRKYAFLLIMIVSAIITPPDIFTLMLLTIPLYALYECSILIISKIK